MSIYAVTFTQFLICIFNILDTRIKYYVLFSIDVPLCQRVQLHLSDYLLHLYETQVKPFLMQGDFIMSRYLCCLADLFAMFACQSLIINIRIKSEYPNRITL